MPCTTTITTYHLLTPCTAYHLLAPFGGTYAVQGVRKVVLQQTKGGNRFVILTSYGSLPHTIFSALPPLPSVLLGNPLPPKGVEGVMGCLAVMGVRKVVMVVQALKSQREVRVMGLKSITYYEFFLYLFSKVESF